MASIRKEILINASPETVWDALKDVGALHTRLVPGFVTDTRIEPGARIVSFGNGQVARELIVDLDETDRRLVWAIVDEPFRHYNASAQVFSEKPGHCRLASERVGRLCCHDDGTGPGRHQGNNGKFHGNTMSLETAPNKALQWDTPQAGFARSLRAPELAR